MSLKQLINALFKLSGSQAMPSDSYQSFTPGTSFTAPQSGWIHFRFITNDANEPWFSVYGANEFSCNLNCSWFVTGGASMFIPVKKGEVVNFSSSGATLEYLRFFPAGGGGLSAFCRKLFSVFGEVQYA